MTSSAAAPAAHGVGEVGVAVGPLAGERHEQHARPDLARVDRAATDRSIGAGEQSAAGQADQVVGGEGGPSRGAARGPPGVARPERGCDGSTSVTAPSLA